MRRIALPLVAALCATANAEVEDWWLGEAPPRGAEPQGHVAESFDSVASFGPAPPRRLPPVGALANDPAGLPSQRSLRLARLPSPDEQLDEIRRLREELDADRVTDASVQLASDSEAPAPQPEETEGGDADQPDGSKGSPPAELVFPAEAKADRPPAATWNLTLTEALRLGVANNPEIRVLQQEPAIFGTVVTEQAAVFDPVTGASFSGGNVNRQARSLIQTFGSPVGSLRTDLFQPFQRDSNLYVRQRLHTGGEVEVGFGTDYQRFDPDGPQLIVNPGWDSEVNLRVSQPLFRGRGAAVADAPIHIAAADSRRTKHAFHAEVRRIVRDVELDYWNLATAYRRYETAVAFRNRAEQVETKERERLRLGQSALPDVLQTQSIVADFRRSEANEFRALRLAELRFRTQAGVAGLNAPEIELMVVPRPQVDELETIADFDVAVQTALQRPELMAQVERVRAVRHLLTVACNGVTPDIRAQFDYAVSGLEPRLDQSIGTIGRHEFNEWNVGLLYERRLGLRSEQAFLDRARIQLTRETAQQQRIEHDLVAALRVAQVELEESRKLLEARVKEVEATSEQIGALEELNAEDPDGNLLFRVLESLRTLAGVEGQLANAWGDRQAAMARWRYERGDDLDVFSL